MVSTIRTASRIPKPLQRHIPSPSTDGRMDNWQPPQGINPAIHQPVAMPSNIVASENLPPSLTVALNGSVSGNDPSQDTRANNTPQIQAPPKLNRQIISYSHSAPPRPQNFPLQPPPYGFNAPVHQINVSSATPFF